MSMQKRCCLCGKLKRPTVKVVPLVPQRQALLMSLSRPWEGSICAGCGIILDKGLLAPQTNTSAESPAQNVTLPFAQQLCFR